MKKASVSGPEAEQIEAPDEGAPGEPLWQRGLYMLGFWFLGNIAFSLSILLGAVQFVLLFLRGETNKEIERFSKGLTKYVWECLAYVTFECKDKPFPIGGFPGEK